jgi:hypothetical protein
VRFSLKSENALSQLNIGLNFQIGPRWASIQRHFSWGATKRGHPDSSFPTAGFAKMFLARHGGSPPAHVNIVDPDVSEPQENMTL